jgi:hypothetical protein
MFLDLLDPDPDPSINKLNFHCFAQGSVADPDPGFGAFLTPGSGMGKKTGSGSGIIFPGAYNT